MTTAWPLAPGGIRWRELDGLVDVVDPLVTEGSRAGGVHQVRWEPARTTRVAFDGVDGRTVVVEATLAGVTLQTVADDPALPGLREVLDPARASVRFEGLLGHPVARCEITVVSYRPGSRCVVRCALRGPSGESVLYVKVLANDAAVCLESHLTLAGTMAPMMPRLVGTWPDLGAVVTEAAPGRSASAVLADPTTRPHIRTTLARALGETLSRVHRAVPGPLVSGRLHSAAHEIDEIERYLPAAWQADPATAVSLSWLARDLRSAHPPATGPAFCHGSFRAGQVVVRDDAMALLDLDSTGVAAPERDLGNAMAYLDWQFLSAPDVGSGSLSPVLLEGYRDAGGVVDRDALTWWHAAAQAKIAGRRYRSLDTVHWDAVPSLVNAAREALEAVGEAPLRPGSGPEIIDAARMTQVLGEALHTLPRARAQTPITVSGIQTLRIAPGRRVVERYRLAGTADPDLELIVKAYAEPERAAIAFDNLTVFATLTDPVVRVGSQEPLALVAERGVVVCRAAPGRLLTEVPDTLAASVVARCAQWLRGVHATTTGLTRRFDLSHEVANLAAWAAEIGRADARLSAPAADLARALARAAPRLPVVTAAVIHKDLHLGHVVVDDTGWAWVIDLDEARMGDPAFDVAHLCAYAEETGSHAARDAFLTSYGDLTGPEVPRRLAYFHAYALLKITKQEARAKGADDETVRGGLRRLERGMSWLAG